MTPAARFFRLLPEMTLAFAVLASAVCTVLFFRLTGYLPQPFVFDTNDTFMDWFNTAYWANNQGIYDVWRSIYPPLSFAFLDMFSLQGCYLQSPFHARDCDWLARATIMGCYVLNVVLAWRCFHRMDQHTATMRGLAFGLGLPLLFTLERGNLILVALPFFMIAHGPLIRSGPWRWLSAAVTINFKPYLVMPVLALAVQRDWRRLELAGIATIALYLVTLALVGGGGPMELASNTAHWVVFQGAQVWNEINYSTSYAPFLALRTAQIPLLQFVPSRLVETIEWLVPLAIRCTQAIALAALAASGLQPKAVSAARLSAIMLGAYLVTQSPGGYTQVFLIFLIFLEPWDRPGPIVAIVCGYLLCIVGDIPLAQILQLTTTSWLSERTVNPAFGLTLGHFVRPGLIVLIVWMLSCDTLVRAIRAHRLRAPLPRLTPA
ncbi:hypothetical protein NT2_09_00540 [Caenibius tardaugens NBRC 16725]|uniref:DUF2029 domain-containing protein n=1 Tax=Caenibius tardaugens NBRC 16725 TaxID=1219035 RepID=U2YAK7_9SPHN|nr:hypothetical protein [Caenibius tardaugens]GAD50446.1 hypothetical protein NT2_09_00540 [Caenibius tardaugens NBRC 16725]